MSSLPELGYINIKFVDGMTCDITIIHNNSINIVNYRIIEVGMPFQYNAGYNEVLMMKVIDTSGEATCHYMLLEGDKIKYVWYRLLYDSTGVYGYEITPVDITVWINEKFKDRIESLIHDGLYRLINNSD